MSWILSDLYIKSSSNLKEYNNLDYNSNFLTWLRMYFCPKNLEGKEKTMI